MNLVKVKAKLTVHGTFVIDSAQLIEEEEYEETVKEKRELPPDEPKAEAEAEPKKEGEGEAAAEGDAKKEEKKEPEKKYEWVDVKKMKKRTKRTDLAINVSGKPGLNNPDIQKLMDQETAMQAEMREIIETDEKRNDLESYIFNMRDKITESGELGPYISSA